MGHIGLRDYVGLLFHFYEKRDIPVKNGIPQIRTEKRSTVFDLAPVLTRPVSGPVSVYPKKNENRQENTAYGSGRNEIYPVNFQLYSGGRHDNATQQKNPRVAPPTAIDRVA